MEDDNSVVSLLTTLSLPRNSNSISLNVGNTMNIQASDLQQGISKKEEDKDLLKNRIPENQAQVSRLQGISDSVFDFTKMYLKEVIDDEPEATYFGMNRVENVISLPETNKETNLALGVIQDALKSIEKSATDSATYTENIKKMMETQSKKKKQGPCTKTLVLPLVVVKSKKTLNMEKSERNLAAKIWKITIQKQVQFDLISNPGIITAYPKSIVRACQMMLFVKKSTLKYTPTNENYGPNVFLAANVILHKPADGTDTGFSDEYKRDLRLFNIPVEPTLREEVIQKIRKADSNHYRPNLRFDHKQIILEIPPFYVNSTDTPGVGKWNRLLGFVAYLKITVKNRGADSPGEYVYIFINGDLDHGQNYIRPIDNVLISLNKNKWMIGENEFPWKKTEPLYLKLFANKIFTEIKVHVTRIYATTPLVSSMYTRLQSVTQQIMWDYKILNLGLASYWKLDFLMSMISNQMGSYSDIPIGLVLDRNISRRSRPSRRKK